jgi:hypothetical protein
METEIIITTPENIKQIFMECLREYSSGLNIQNPTKEESYVSSISTLAEFLKCSRTCAQKFKNEHPKIFKQYGRKFLASKIDILNVLSNNKIR